MGQKRAKKTNGWAKAGIAFALVLATYFMGSRAIDTGSLGQYTLTLLLVILSIRQIIAVFVKK